MLDKFLKIIRCKRWKGTSLTPLEAVLFLEAEDPESSRLQSRSCFLRDVALWDVMDAYGNGTDRLLNDFESRLKRMGLYRVYILMRKEMDNTEIARKLGMEVSEAREAERKIIALFRMRTRPEPARLNSSSVQTLLALMRGKYRLFLRHQTGYVEYLFYHETRQLASAIARVLPDWPVVIRTDNSTVLNTSVDPDTTLQPGSYREVTDADEPSLVAARVIWDGFGEHRLLRIPSGKEIQIRTEGENRFFYMDGKLIARMSSLPQKQSALYGFSVSCVMEVYTNPDTTTALLMLAFPILQLGP